MLCDVVRPGLTGDEEIPTPLHFTGLLSQPGQL